jgi:subtilisin family serine protease
VCAFSITAYAQGIVHQPGRIANRYLVQFDDAKLPDAPRLAEALSHDHGVKQLAVWTAGVRGFAFEGSEAAAVAIAKDPRVLRVEEDARTTLACCSTITAPVYGGCLSGEVPWQLDRLDQFHHASPPLQPDGKYKLPYADGSGVTIYIVDTGVRGADFDFSTSTGASRVTRAVNFVDGETQTDDCIGHGTTVADLAAGKVAGVAKSANIVSVRVIGCSGTTTGSIASGNYYNPTTGTTGSNYSVIQGLEWIANDHPGGNTAVANISIVSPLSGILDSVVAELVNHRKVVVISAANNGGAADNSCNHSPGDTSMTLATLTVGATTDTDTLADFTSGGMCTNMLAPGYKLAATTLSGAFVCGDISQSGTSYAAPIVAGVAALYIEEHPFTTPTDTVQALINEAEKGVIVLPASGLQSYIRNQFVHPTEACVEIPECAYNPNQPPLSQY